MTKVGSDTVHNILWSEWVSNEKTEMSDIAFWKQAIENSPVLAKTFSPYTPDHLYVKRLKSSGVGPIQMLSKPPGTEEYKVVKRLFSSDVGDEVISHLVYFHPAELAKLLKTAPHASEILVGYKNSENSNLAHFLARKRCFSKDAFTRKMVSWSRLESWVEHNIVHLLDDVDKSGQTPMQIIAELHPTWHARLARFRLSKEVESKALSQPNSRQASRSKI